MPVDETEHQRLLRITAELEREREHEGFKMAPNDLEAHAAHRDKLRHHIQELQAYIQRLRTPEP